MDLLKVIFWFFLGWVILTLVIRIYWYKKEKYGYASWFFEWLLACLSCTGIYIVAYDTPLLNQAFWSCILFIVTGTTVYRFKSRRLKDQLKQLNKLQVLFVKSLMILFTAPVVVILFVNANNLTGVWNS